MKRRSSNLAAYFRRLFWIAVFSLAVGAGLQIAAAIASGVFEKHSMYERMAARNRDMKSAVEAYTQWERQKEVLESHLLTNDLILASASKDQRVDLLAVSNVYERDLAKMKPPVSIQPLDGHIVLYFWPIMYFCLGVLIFIFDPIGEFDGSGKTHPSWRSIASTAILLFIIQMTPLWFRNGWSANHMTDRILYAFPNIDIAPLSFIVQNINYVVFAFLLALVWDQWSQFYDRRLSQVRNSQRDAAIAFLTDPRRQRDVSDALLRFQIAFALTSIGFVFFSTIFWDQVIANQVKSMIIEAVVIHSIWIVTAVIIALPFLVTWHQWESKKMEAYAELLKADTLDAATVSSRRDILTEIQPVGAWNIAASGVAVVSSLVAPIVQVLVK